MYLTGKITNEVIPIKLLFFIFIMLLIPVNVSAQNYDNLLPIINASVGISEYDSEYTDINELMYAVLSTHENFVDFSTHKPMTDISGTLKMCNAQYIKDVMFAIFRQDAPFPDPSQVNTIGYYYNNGYYYYKNDYSYSKSVTINQIENAIPINENKTCIIFNDGSSDYSMCFASDDVGYYITAIDMKFDYSTLHDKLQNNSKSLYIDVIYVFLPLIVVVITLVAVIIVFIRFILF